MTDCYSFRGTVCVRWSPDGTLVAHLYCIHSVGHTMASPIQKHDKF